jgi:hypothetical protein
VALSHWSGAGPRILWDFNGGCLRATIRYEMTPVDGTHVDLQLLGGPVAIRPFRLKKS